MPDFPATAPQEPLLRFFCGSCGHGLEAPADCAGVEGPCPMCGVEMRAPHGFTANGSAADHSGIHLPPLNEETGLVELPMDFWEAQAELPDFDPAETKQEVGPSKNPQIGEPDPPRLKENLLEVLPSPPAVVLPAPRQRMLPTRDEEEAQEIAGDRKQAFPLKFFDAAVILLFAGTLAMGGAALAFTQSKHDATPPPPPELSKQVVERMQEVDRKRDLAVAEGRETVRRWVTAPAPDTVAALCLPGDPTPLVPGGVGATPADFEFIQARRLPGTEQFLTLFEVLADPPLVAPVEQTPAGARLHGQAIRQQQEGTLATFLASQGRGEAVFYVLLRHGPATMTQELVRTRPDLGPFIHVAVEPAFPADGTSACLACLKPESEAAAIFAKRAHDPGLRPAVVKLAWRQHRESGNYIELVSFEPNAWSRH